MTAKSVIGALGNAPTPLAGTDLVLISRDGTVTLKGKLSDVLAYVLAAVSGDRGDIVIGGTGNLVWSVDINGQTADGTPDLTADYLLSYDQSAGANKKIKLNVLLPDGSKGDITVSGNNTTWTVASGSISLAKMANMATASIIGRATAGSGAPEVLSVGGGLETAAGLIRRSAVSGDLSIPAGSNTSALTKLVEYFSIVATNLTTGTTLPLSIADSAFTGKAAGGSIAGNGAAGVVASSFASSGAEAGTSAAQGGLGSAASSTQPYNATDFPGQRGVLCALAKADGDQIVLVDILSTATAADRDAEVYGYLSFRSDLGSNLKWRLWYYYRRASDGFETPITPDTSLTAVSLSVALVDAMGNLPVAAFTGRPQFGQMAAQIGAKAIGTTQLDDLAVTTAKVADQAVTLAKLINATTTSRILVRKTAGAGVWEEGTVSDVLNMIASVADGDILVRVGGAWVRLASPSDATKFLQGTASPGYAAIPAVVNAGASGLMTGADKAKLDLAPAYVSAGASLTSTVSVNNSTADTTILTLTALANTLGAGGVFEFEIWGDADNVVTAAPVMNWWLKDQGGTKRAALAITCSTSAKTNQAWRLNGQINIRTLTASGTFRIGNRVESLSPAALTAAFNVGNTDLAIDATINNTFTLGMNWGTANASNTLRAHEGYFIQDK